MIWRPAKSISMFRRVPHRDQTFVRAARTQTMSETALAPFAAWSAITGVLILASSMAYRAYSRRKTAA